MTTVDNPALIIFDNGGTDEITIDTEHVEEIRSKILRLIKRPVSKTNRSAGVKVTSILDLLRVEHRFTIRGSLDTSDKSKLNNLFEQGGPFDMLWEGTTYDANMEKFTYTKDNRENSERPVVITIVVGGDL